MADDSTTLTVHLGPEVERRLESVVSRVHRSEAFLAAEAIEEFLAVQEWQIAAIEEGIEEGIAAAERGDLISHEDARAWVESWGSEHELPQPGQNEAGLDLDRPHPILERSEPILPGIMSARLLRWARVS
jgi:predicted transcriptional regulator